MTKMPTNNQLDGKRFTVSYIHPNDITVLPQMRKTFNEDSIRDLAESIRANGQINEALVNKIGTKLLLIAGERRLRAIRYLHTTDSSHLLKCKVFVGLTASECFQLQIAENIHENVPPAQEAEALYGLWQIKIGSTDLSLMTMKEFCHLVGKGESKVRDALRFIENLHPIIQRAVQEQEASQEKSRKALTYSAAVEIARLRDLDEQLLVYGRCLVANAKSEAQVKLFSKPFMDRQRGQTEFFELQLSEYDELKTLQSVLRKTYAPLYEGALRYIERIMSALSNNILPEQLLTEHDVNMFRKALELDRELEILARNKQPNDPA